MAIELKIGNVYSFTTINANHIGGNFTKVKLRGLVDYNTAKLLSPNIDAVQSSLVPYISPGVSLTHTAYRYYVFEKQTGGIAVFPIEWMNADSITEDSINFIDIRILGANSSDLAAIRNILGLSGFLMVNELK